MQMRWHLYVLLVLLGGLSGCGDGSLRSGHNTPVPNRAVLDAESPTEIEATSVQEEPDVKLDEGLPEGAGELVATVVEDADGRLAFQVTHAVGPGKRPATSGVLGLYRGQRRIGRMALAFSCVDEETGKVVASFRNFTRAKYGLRAGDKLYTTTLGYAARGPSGGSRSGLGMPFGDSMWGPWR